MPTRRAGHRSTEGRHRQPRWRGVRVADVGRELAHQPELVEIDGGIAKFDLTFSLADSEQGLAGYVEYSTDLFDRSTIERMIGHFQVLLEGVVTDPDQSISTLPLFSGGDSVALRTPELARKTKTTPIAVRFFMRPLSV